MLSRILKTLALLFLVAVVGTGWGFWRLSRWGDEAAAIDGFRVVDFPAGTPLVRLSQALEDQGLVSQALLFYAWVRVFDGYQGFQAGKYRYEGRVSPRDIVEKIRKGEVYNPVVLSYTIPEGFPLRQ